MEALNIDTCLATFRTEENQRALKSSTELAAMEYSCQRFTGKTGAN